LNTKTINNKLVKKIKDDKFDVMDLHHYNLSFQIGTRDFQLLVTDSRTNKALLLEDFILSNVPSYKELTKTLDGLFDSHQLLRAGFWNKIRIGFKNNKFSLVPSSLFSEDGMYDYLKINAKIDPGRDKILYYRHTQNEAVNVFSVNKVLYEWVVNNYEKINVECIHQSSNIIEGVLSQVKKYQENNIFLYIDRFKLHVITTRNRKLEYYNQFVIKQFSDYIKYIMTVMKGLDYNQSQTSVVLWGYISKQSAHYQEFSKYIKNLSFGERPDFLNFGYFFDEVQDHHFFDLYGLQVCD